MTDDETRYAVYAETAVRSFHQADDDALATVAIPDDAVAINTVTTAASPPVVTVSYLVPIEEADADD